MTLQVLDTARGLSGHSEEAHQFWPLLRRYGLAPATVPSLPANPLPSDVLALASELVAHLLPLAECLQSSLGVKEEGQLLRLLQDHAVKKEAGRPSHTELKEPGREYYLTVTELRAQDSSVQGVPKAVLVAPKHFVASLNDRPALESDGQSPREKKEYKEDEERSLKRLYDALPKELVSSIKAIEAAQGMRLAELTLAEMAPVRLRLEDGTAIVLSLPLTVQQAVDHLSKVIRFSSPSSTFAHPPPGCQGLVCSSPRLGHRRHPPSPLP